jgi:O-antigen/teichoic acid export membrane protein
MRLIKKYLGVGRDADRLKVAGQTSLANFGSKGVSMLLMIVSVHYTIGYLGPERFGVWMTLMSFVAMLSFLDLGVGNALTNLTAERATKGDASYLRQAISSGLLIMAGCGLGVAVVILGLAQIIPWTRLFRLTDPELVSEARAGGMVFAIGFGAVLFSGGVQKVLLGLQRAASGHIASMCANVVAIFALIIAAEYRAGVPTLLAITLAGQSIGAIPLLATLFKDGLLDIGAGWGAIRTEAPYILRSGGLFFLLQVGFMVGWGADLLIVSTTLGAALAATYAVAQRLFQFASMPIQILTQPLWGAYAEANARGDRAFISRVLKFSLTGAAVMALITVSLLILVHGPLVARWTEDRIVLPVSFVLIYGMWSIIEATTSAASMYLNGCNIIRPQVFAVVIFCFISIPLKIALGYFFGLQGIVLATIVAWIIAVPILYAIFFRHDIMRPARI